MKTKTPPVRTHFPLGPNPFLEKSQPFINPQSCDAQGQKYTSEEIEMLRTTSKINGVEYVPFMSVDLREHFAYPMPFCDILGKLALSPKQKQKQNKTKNTLCFLNGYDLKSSPPILQ